ncbi:MAG: sigma-70 family RNA polymerase sigma factor [Acidobacteria bacterium]|nr:sigma-70 family RNA polymerase sigma factor [Acidobacteriota bacterium]
MANLSGENSAIDVTGLLLDWGNGEKDALDSLLPLIYNELRRVAESYLRRDRPGHTLQATALVNEAFLRLIDQNQINWQNRAHFFGAAANLMRQILIQHARANHAAKRGGERQKLYLDEAGDVAQSNDLDLVALDDALRDLEAIAPRQCRIVELRYFGGLNIEETGEVLFISPATVKREWTMAKAWLRREISNRNE